MNVFVFDLLLYAEHLDHLKEGKELPFGREVLPALKRHPVTKAAIV